MHQPAGFQTVVPYLFVDGAAAFLQFLSDGLGAREVLRHAEGERIAHAQVLIGDAVMMVSDTAADFPAMPSSFYVYTPNADQAVAKAIAAGAVLISAVEDKPYQDRQGGVRDRWGNIWWISQRLTAELY